MKLIALCSALFLTTLPLLEGTQLRPWLFERDFIVEAHAENTYQKFNSVKSGSHRFQYKSNDNFLNLGAGLSGFDYSAEAELTLASTRKQSFDLDNVKVTGRIRLSDDIVGDPLSTALGLSVDQALRNSLNDLASFHHGLLEAELHLAFGREFACYDRWAMRWWGLVGIGVADLGQPWLHGHLAYEFNCMDQQYLAIFADYLYGLGSQNIRECHFHGYGNIKHRSLDLGLGYTYIFDNDASLSLQFSHRAYARNFPINANRIQLTYMYPFALGF